MRESNPSSWLRSRRAPVVPALLLSLIIGMPRGMEAADTKPTGFAFLSIGGGARAVGMGETLVADGDDPFVIEYNPAGLVGAERFTVSFSHSSFFLDTRGEYVAAAIPVGRWTLGARVVYIGTDAIPRRTGPSEDPISFFDAAAGIFQLAIAGPVDDRLSVGLSGGWVVEHIVESAQSAVFGLGVLYRLRSNIKVGAAFVNVGPPAKFVKREFQMPNLLRAGFRWMIGPASARVEMLAGDNDNVKWHLGTEVVPDPRFAARAGFQFGYDTHWFAAGFGVQSPEGRYGFDYAYAPYTDDFGATHRFGLTVRP